MQRLQKEDIVKGIEQYQKTSNTKNLITLLERIVNANPDYNELIDLLNLHKLDLSKVNANQTLRINKAIDDEVKNYNALKKTQPEKRKEYSDQIDRLGKLKVYFDQKIKDDKIKAENQKLLKESTQHIRRYRSDASKDVDAILLQTYNSNPSKPLNLVNASLEAYKNYCISNPDQKDRKKYRENIIQFLNEYEKHPAQFKQQTGNAEKIAQQERIKQEKRAKEEADRLLNESIRDLQSYSFIDLANATPVLNRIISKNNTYAMNIREEINNASNEIKKKELINHYALVLQFSIENGNYEHAAVIYYGLTGVKQFNKLTETNLFIKNVIKKAEPIVERKQHLDLITRRIDDKKIAIPVIAILRYYARDLGESLKIKNERLKKSIRTPLEALQRISSGNLPRKERQQFLNQDYRRSWKPGISKNNRINIEIIEKEQTYLNNLIDLINLRSTLKTSVSNDKNAMLKFIDLCEKVIDSSNAFTKAYINNNFQFTPEVMELFKLHLNNLAELSREGENFSLHSNILTELNKSKYGKAKLQEIAFTGHATLIHYDTLFERMQNNYQKSLRFKKVQTNQEPHESVRKTIKKLDISFEYDKNDKNSFENLLNFIDELSDVELKKMAINIKGEGLLNDPPNDSTKSLNFLLRQLRNENAESKHDARIVRVSNVMLDMRGEHKPPRPK